MVVGGEGGRSPSTFTWHAATKVMYSQRLGLGLTWTMMVWESCVSWSNVAVVVSTPEDTHTHTHTHTHTMKDNIVNPCLSQYLSQLYYVPVCIV